MIKSQTSAGPGETIFQCQECGFRYRTIEWAEKCERYCREHKACDLEITKNSIERSAK